MMSQNGCVGSTHTGTHISQLCCNSIFIGPVASYLYCIHSGTFLYICPFNSHLTYFCLLYTFVLAPWAHTGTFLFSGLLCLPYSFGLPLSSVLALWWPRHTRLLLSVQDAEKYGGNLEINKKRCCCVCCFGKAMESGGKSGRKINTCAIGGEQMVVVGKEKALQNAV